MSKLFEELDYRQTPIGELILQRRLLEGEDVYEVKLNDEYLMSSMFHAAEEQLAERALALLPGGNWDVVVGGLGLGYTAAAALKNPQVKRLVVVECMQSVIDWHNKALVPNGRTLTDDPRCIYHQADFFALARAAGFDPDVSNRQFDAILLDIDHTPDQLLAAAHADFYTDAGLRRLAQFIKPGGVFAMWSNEPPNARFLERLSRVFAEARGELITFENPLQQKAAANGLYLARRVRPESTEV
ncbi:MAG: spermidine synthase [Kiritimatiellia bacterium]|nr:spermidine synthase [Lentisphaerota bacterium]